MTNTRVLVVEDEVVVARDLQESLIELGYDVPDIAITADEAIQKTAAMEPDLVLMDIHLKGERDGIDAATEIRDRFSIPVVYLTAYADATTLHRAKLAAPFGYILKPWVERELQTTIEVSLYRHDLEQQLRCAHVELQTAHNHLSLQLRVAECRDRMVQAQMMGPTEQEAYDEIEQALGEALPVKEVMLYLPQGEAEDLALVTTPPATTRRMDHTSGSMDQRCEPLVEAAFRTGKPGCDAGRVIAAAPVLYRHKPMGVIVALAEDDTTLSQQALNALYSLACQAALLLRMASMTAAISAGDVRADQLLNVD